MNNRIVPDSQFESPKINVMPDFKIENPKINITPDDFKPGMFVNEAYLFIKKDGSLGQGALSKKLNT